jgi:hypothetical protein
MKPQEVQDRLDKISAMASDYEAAHAEEDALYADVLEHIAAGKRGGRELARLAITSRDIHFARHCA